MNKSSGASKKTGIVILIAVAAMFVFWLSRNEQQAVMLKVSASPSRSSVKQPLKAIQWSQDIGLAIQKAKIEKKTVLVDFYADWCSACKMLDEMTYPDSAVSAQISKNFIAVKVNVDANRKAANEYGVHALPTIVLLNSQGKEIRRSLGFLPPAEFIKKLQMT